MSMMTFLFLARSQIVPIQSATFPMEIFTLQSACSYYCPPWSPHPPVDCFSAIALQRNYVLLVGQPLTDFLCLSHCIPFHPSSWFSASKFCLLALLPLGCILVKSSHDISSGSKNHIWSSLCHLDSLPMVHSFLSHAKSSSPNHSLFFPHCIVCNTQHYHIPLMSFWNDTMLLILPWSTQKEHMPCPNMSKAGKEDHIETFK